MTHAANFGPLITEVDVDQAVLNTLRLWMPTYLAQYEREREVANGTFARPKAGSYANTLTEDEFVDHRLPAVIVTTAETAETPERSPQGYSVSWRVVVSVVSRGKTPPLSRMTGAVFGATVRRILAQQSDLGGFASGLWWTRSAIEPIQDVRDDGRYLTAAVNEFVVQVDSAVGLEGPVRLDPVYDDPNPAGDPNASYGPLVPVSTVNLTVTRDV